MLNSGIRVEINNQQNLLKKGESQYKENTNQNFINIFRLICIKNTISNLYLCSNVGRGKYEKSISKIISINLMIHIHYVIHQYILHNCERWENSNTDFNRYYLKHFFFYSLLEVIENTQCSKQKSCKVLLHGPCDVTTNSDVTTNMRVTIQWGEHNTQSDMVNILLLSYMY